MAAPYQQQPDFDYYRQPQWPADNKPTCSEGDDLSLLDDKILDTNTPAEVVTENNSRRTSLDSRPNSFTLRSAMWQETPQSAMFDQNRQQAHASVPMIDTSRAQYSRMDMAHDLEYNGPQTWPPSTMSGTSTPTPSFEPHSQEYHSMPYSAGSLVFNGMSYGNHPYSATPMSPQSSQGEWMSANSSDGAEPRTRGLGSPTYRTNSPVNGLRRDEVRKKNTRFEIPNDRNLANIDSLILQTTDEKEKKELKQQKRLLRNRQAALDSRQRKKLHTEKLENEKKEFNQHMSDLQDENRQLREAYQAQAEAIRQVETVAQHQRQDYENYIQTITFERDEAIRTKTLETAELRKQIDIFKAHIRDQERQAASGNLLHDYANQFSTFEDMGVEHQGWEEDFSIVNSTDYRNQIDQRATTPTPSKPTPLESKPDAPFSWNAFYMCLLFGAFIASNSNSTSKPSVPALSEEYRAEAANVLKAVMSPGTKDPHSLMPSSLASVPNHFTADQPHPLMAHGTTPGPDPAAQDSLGALHATLTTPSRYQRESAAFGLSAASYDHLTNPDPFMAVADDEPFDSKPTQLQSAFNAMQESRSNVDKVMNRGVGERSIMWDRVPEKVLRDFRRMVSNTEMRH